MIGVPASMPNEPMELTVIVEPVKGGAPVGRIKSIVLANGQTLVAIAPAPAGPPPPAP